MTYRILQLFLSSLQLSSNISLLLRVKEEDGGEGREVREEGDKGEGGDRGGGEEEDGGRRQRKGAGGRQKMKTEEKSKKEEGKRRKQRMGRGGKEGRERDHNSTVSCFCAEHFI